MSTTKTYIENKTQLVPALRFKEFDGEWNNKRLSEISRIERGRFSPRPRNNPIYYGGEIPFVQTSDVVNSNGRISTYSQTLNEKGLNVSKKFSKGTLLITIAANIGYAGVLEIDMACPDSLVGLTCKNELHNWFLNYLLEIEQSKMDYLAVAAAQKNINIEFLRPYRFNLPSLPEQQKIASFLSAVDEKIRQLTRKKELLERYKKGVMQKLFNQEIRFKQDDGSDYPDWEEKRLGDVGNFKNGLNKDKKDFGFGSPFVNLMDVFGKNVLYGGIFDLVNATEKDKVLYDIREGDVLFIRSSVKRTGVGEAVVVFENIANTVYSGFIIRFREKKNLLNLSFKKYCFASVIFRKELLSYATTSANTNINQESLSEIKVSIPSLAEQQKIAEYLSSIDNKIESVNHQITQTQTFKKGLLQGMFV